MSKAEAKYASTPKDRDVRDQRFVTSPPLTLYELINPSDAYTFYAPSIEVAGACACMLSSGFGATPVEGDGESTPVLFGWQEWLADRGINDQWITDHKDEIADAFESFLIGGVAERKDVESMLAMLPDENRQKWRDQRQDRHRSSMNQIGESAYKMAEAIRKRSS